MVLIFHGLTNYISHGYLYEMKAVCSKCIWSWLSYSLIHQKTRDLRHYKCFLKITKILSFPISIISHLLQAPSESCSLCQVCFEIDSLCITLCCVWDPRFKVYQNAIEFDSNKHWTSIVILLFSTFSSSLISGTSIWVRNQVSFSGCRRKNNLVNMVKFVKVKPDYLTMYNITISWFLGVVACNVILEGTYYANGWKEKTV